MVASTVYGSPQARDWTCASTATPDTAIRFLFFFSPFLLFFFFFFATPPDIEVLGQEWDPNHSFNLCHTCSNARSYNPLSLAGDWTHVLALQRCHQSHCATAGISSLSPYFNVCFLFGLNTIMSKLIVWQKDHSILGHWVSRGFSDLVGLFTDLIFLILKIRNLCNRV